jgi:hypothetical protein
MHFVPLLHLAFYLVGQYSNVALLTAGLSDHIVFELFFRPSTDPALFGSSIQKLGSIAFLSCCDLNGCCCEREL